MKMRMIRVSDEFISRCPALAGYLATGGPERDEDAAWAEVEALYAGWERIERGGFVLFTHPETGATAMQIKPFKPGNGKAVWLTNPDIKIPAA